MINPQTGREFTKDFFKDYAEGKPCQIRVAAAAGYQCADWETTVLCHITLPGLKAMGKKLIPDLLASWGCGCCHDLVDGRVRPTRISSMDDLGSFERIMMMHNAHMDGMARTLNLLVKAGLLPNP